jgi:hypothetical protein
MGNPGGFQTWYYGLCDAGYCKYAGTPPNGHSSDLQEPPKEVIEFRALTSINSVAVAGTGCDLRLYSPGPYRHTVRLRLREPDLQSRWRAWRLQRKKPLQVWARSAWAPTLLPRQATFARAVRGSSGADRVKEFRRLEHYVFVR